MIRVDGRAGRLTLEVDGDEQSYASDRALLERVGDGDRIRFDVEERPDGRSVIVAIH